MLGAALQDAVSSPKHSSSPKVKIELTKTPTGVAFGNNNEELVVATSGLLGQASLGMYTRKGGSQPLWELKDCLEKKPALPGGLASGYRESNMGGHPLAVMAAGGKGRACCKSAEQNTLVLLLSPNGRYIHRLLVVLWRPILLCTLFCLPPSCHALDTNARQCGVQKAWLICQ